MLPSAEDFKNQILTLTPTNDPISGVTAFVGVIASFMNSVQAGSTGTPGIFTFNNAVMIPLILAMPPVKDDSWISAFVSAWQAAVIASIIVPGTVTNPIWVGSGSLDVATLPTAAATILTIPVASAILASGLNSVSSSDDKTLQFATAIRNATLVFTFTCIGLGVPPTFVPIPIPIPAQ